MSLFLFLILVLFFAYRGYKKGLFKSIVKVLSLIAGYAATILYILPVSSVLEAKFQLSGIAAFIIASTVLFIGAFVSVNLLLRLVGKLWSKSKDKSTVSAIGGAVVGSLVGIIVAIVLVWGFTLANNLRPVAPGQVLTEKPSSLIERVAKQVVRHVAEVILSATSTSPELKNLSRVLIETPGEISQQVQRLAKSNDLNALFGDPGNQAVLNSGDAGAVQQLPAFQRLVKNPDMLSLAKSAAMLGESGDNVELAETTLAVQTTETWLRVQQVKNDQRVQEIMNNPEFLAKLQSGNPLDLLTNSKLLELANIIFEDKNAGNRSATSEVKQPLPDTIKKQTKIYSWTDDEGRVYYSDVDPKP